MGPIHLSIKIRHAIQMVSQPGSNIGDLVRWFFTEIKQLKGCE